MDEEARFRRAVEATLAWEGGYVDDPDDPGGETKYGITARDHPGLDIKNLTREQAIAIYKRDFWGKYGLARLPDPIAQKVFDMAVNMGPTAAFRCLQRALNACGQQVLVDGILGPKTVEATGRAPSGWLMAQLRLEAVRHYLALTDQEPKRLKFLRGWIRRALS